MGMSVRQVLQVYGNDDPASIKSVKVRGGPRGEGDGGRGEGEGRRAAALTAYMQTVAPQEHHVGQVVCHWQGGRRQNRGGPHQQYPPCLPIDKGVAGTDGLWYCPRATQCLMASCIHSLGDYASLLSCCV